MKLNIIFLIILMSISMSLPASEWKPLSGIYAVTGENYLDPSDEEPDNTHYRLQLDGPAAADLYLAMPSVITIDECTGAEQKTVGDMKCLYYASEARYECAFSINLTQNRIEYGVAC